jgi:hypothetical protein
MELFKTPKFNYIKYHKIFFGVSVVLALLTIVRPSLPGEKHFQH